MNFYSFRFIFVRKEPKIPGFTKFIRVALSFSLSRDSRQPKLDLSLLVAVNTFP